MNDPAHPPRTAFLIGTEAVLIDRLREAGIRVLGGVADLDLYFPLARHCGAGLLVLAEDGAGARGLSEAVAQLRIVSPSAEIAVLARETGADLSDAGAGMVFGPPHDPAAIAQALAKGVALVPPAPGGWRTYNLPPASGESVPAGGSLAFRRETAWRSFENSYAENGPLPLRQQVIAVLGTRGGVGRTFLAANTAAAVAMASRARTLLVDLSPTGDAGMHLDLRGGPTLIEMLPELGAARGEDLGRHVIIHPTTGLHVLAGNPRPELNELVTPEHVEALLTWARREYDLIFLNTPSRFPDERLICCARHATRILLVTTAEVTAVRQGRFLLEWLSQRQVALPPRVDLVINRTDPEGSLSPGEVRQLIGLDPVVTVPEDRRAVERAVFAGRPVATRPDNPLAQAVWRIAALFHPVQPGGTGEASRPSTLLSRLLSPVLSRVNRP